MISHVRSNQDERFLDMKTNFLPRVVLVTGGTEGVGESISKKMNDDGFIVAVTYRNEKQAVAWQDAMEKEGRLFFIYPNDVKSLPSSKRLVDHISKDIGPVDVLVNAAGRGFGRRCEYDSAFNITCAVMDDMLDKEFGRVINVSFMNDRRKNNAEGVHALTRELSCEVSKQGVTINTVSLSDVLSASGVFDGSGDVAAVVSSLVTDEASLVTGQDIPVNMQGEKEVS